MGDGFEFLVGGCLADGSGELEWEEKDVPGMAVGADELDQVWEHEL